MKKKVEIYIKSIQLAAHQEDIIEQEFIGKLWQEADKSYISYDDDLSDPDRTIESLLIIGEGEVSIIRDSAGKIHLKLKTRLKSEYASPYGLIEMETYADKILWEVNEGKYSLKMNYSLFAGQEIKFIYLLEASQLD